MDSRTEELLREHLQQAEAHIAQGEQLIAKQKAILSKLEQVGGGGLAARSLLNELEEAQAMHLAHRDGLCRKLGLSE
jgi:hypothetical protein